MILGIALQEGNETIACMKAVCVFALALQGLLATNASAQPNVLYILADDLGYGDLSCYGSKSNKTPHIDALGANGIRLTDFHAAAWCAPSRRALMTGCHANRPWNVGDQKWGRLASSITIPEMLKEVGYTTALIGKWHLEMSEGLHPLDQGFDYWFGTRGSNDWDGPRPNYDSFKDSPEEAWKTPLYINRDSKGPMVPQSAFTKRYTEETCRLICESQDAPFFIYLAHNMPHVPIHASERFRGSSKNGVYGDVIAELDWSVGELVRTLRESGKLDNTLVVFTSDNGPWTMFEEFGGEATPLRGEKSTTWEGGERVPFIASWPDRIQPGLSDALIVNTDIYATLASLSGAKIKSGQAIDSHDVSGLLLKGRPSTRQTHLYYFHQAMAYRKGDHKIHLKTRKRTRDPKTGRSEPSVEQDPPLLYNLESDLVERKPITDQPQLTSQLQREFLEAQRALKAWEPLPN